MKAVLIGAGKIGRGFIGQVLHEQGFELNFVDTSQSLVDMLNLHKGYPVFILGGTKKEYIVDNIRGYSADDPKAIEALVTADIVTTAVGPPVLPQTAGFIASGIKQRYKAGIKAPMDVIACENMEYGTSMLYSEVEKLLNEQELQYCHQYIGFPDTEVSRIAIPIEEQESNHPLAVKVEQYVEWIVDKCKVKGNLGAVKSIELTDNPTAYIKRKIYTLTGHAMLGYLGYKKGYSYIYEAAYDNEIFYTVYKALKECGEAWSKEYHMDKEIFNLYTTIMLRRFSDTRLRDSVERVCFQPIRKLSKNERFVGPALIAFKHGITPFHIVKGLVSALKYDSPKDEQAIELHKSLKEKGLEYVLGTVCGLEMNDQLSEMIVKEYLG